MYDPLAEHYPAPRQGYPHSYWAADIQAEKSPVLEQDLHSEVVIIGAGYTGLSAAYHLAKDYNIHATVIDANEVGWGCSGRNAGFVLPGSGRLSLMQMRKKWGLAASQGICAEFREAVATVEQLIDLGKIDCDVTRGGYLKVAHNRTLAQQMEQQVLELQNTFSQKVEFCSAAQINANFMLSSQAFGAMHYADYFSLNPLKLVQGYARLALEQGAQIYANSPLIDWRQEQKKHRLVTPKGSIVCDKVIIATNGYTGKSLHPLIKNSHFPVMSSIIVTRPLSAKELESIGMKGGLMVMDTRALKYYYRLLPDGRLLFGGRGAIKGKDADRQAYSNALLGALIATFPQLHNISVAYFWSGWVSVSYDDYPRIWGSEDNNVLYAMGYCGSGLSFAAQAGKRLAQKLASDTPLPAIPFMQSPLAKFPMASMRRIGLSLYYKWAQLKR
ncbi:MAG: glycine/D-amino acid oxidase-like deaminating enzyme [Paraglaciecola sp.]|jgi:glycine/D-amino acid oxidase-like deaminating enzyme